MLRRLKRAAVAGFSSTLSFVTRTRPAISAASSAITGAIIRHGPHHGAQASTSTGSGERSTSEAKVASLTVSGSAAMCSGALHRPHRGLSPAASFSTGTRLVAPHEEHRIILCSGMNRRLALSAASLLGRHGVVRHHGPSTTPTAGRRPLGPRTCRETTALPALADY